LKRANIIDIAKLYVRPALPHSLSLLPCLIVIYLRQTSIPSFISCLLIYMDGGHFP